MILSLTFSDWFLTPGNKFQLRKQIPIEEMNKKELSYCRKRFCTSNIMENFAHGEQELHRFPPQFNFYNCTNVQIHNNFSGSGLNWVGKYLQKFFFIHSNSVNLTNWLGMIVAFYNSFRTRRAVNLFINMWHCQEMT